MNYCPLCRAEFRPEVVTCATCGAMLVPSLEAGSVKENPPRLLWIGKDAAEFDLVAGLLREAGIPAHAEEAATGLLGSFLKEQSQIHVLDSDLERALAVASEAITTQASRRARLQACYQCGAQSSVAFARCPQCKTVLRVEEPRNREKQGFSSGPPEPGTLRYCPVCDAEYTAAFDRCTVCGVDLVPEELRGRPLDEKGRLERIIVVWRAGDPVAVSRAIAALRDAGISHHVKSGHDYFVFGLAMPRPKYELRVFESDAETARRLLADIRETLPFSLSEEEPDLAAEPTEATPRRHAAAERKPSQATAEIWRGEDAGLAQILEDCLRENSIVFRREGLEPGTLRIFVPPADAAPAHEILRELREGTPPT